MALGPFRKWALFTVDVGKLWPRPNRLLAQVGLSPLHGVTSPQPGTVDGILVTSWGDCSNGNALEVIWLPQQRKPFVCASGFSEEVNLGFPTWPFYTTGHSFLDTLPSALVFSALFWIIPYQAYFLLSALFKQQIPPSPHLSLCTFSRWPTNTHSFNYSLWPDVFQIFISSSDFSLNSRPAFSKTIGHFHRGFGVRKIQVHVRTVLLTSSAT